MLRYYCSCHRGTVRYEYQHTTMHETEVDKEGICTYCGHYAFTRANVKHELFPRHGGKVTDMSVHSNSNYWSDIGLYHQYYNGCAPLRDGLSGATLKKDQQRIKDEREKRSGNQLK